MSFDQLKFITRLVAFSSRQLENETKAGELITSCLDENHIPYKCQRFTVKVPKNIKAELLADNQKINCQSSSFISGTILGKANLVNSLLFDCVFDFPNINFNPLCSDISIPSFSINHPSLAIAAKDLPILLKAKKVIGKVDVKPINHTSQNILVGNIDNPRAIIFTHYDSINMGVFDNAGGATTTLKLIIDNPTLLKQCLFVISGNEELSYDFPTYWGYGYRVFEKKYLKQLNASSSIIVVDGIGNGNLKFLNDAYWTDMAFPIKNMIKFLPKTLLACADTTKLMSVYHSNADNLKQVSGKFLQVGLNQLLTKIMKMVE